MGRVNFTKSFINGLGHPESGQVTYSDTKSRGLKLIVTSGSKTFYLRRKIYGRSERIKIGRFPETTIEQARKQAAKINNEFDAEINPNEVKRQRRAEITFAQLFEIYFEQHVLPNNKVPNNATRNYRLYLEEAFGATRISQVTKANIAAHHRKLATDISQRTANIMLILIRAIFNKAIEWDMWYEVNPTQGIRKYPEKSRDRFLQRHELRPFFEAVAQENELMRDFFLLLLLTGARKGNVMSMSWLDVDLQTGIWQIPDTKNGTPHVVPLSERALQILIERFKYRTNEYVFPGDGVSGHLKEPKKAWARILSRANLKGLTMHDIRRTHGSYLAMTGASMPVIGKSLGHKSQDSTAIYARLDLEPVKEAIVKSEQIWHMEGLGETLINVDDT